MTFSPSLTAFEAAGTKRLTRVPAPAHAWEQSKNLAGLYDGLIDAAVADEMLRPRPKTSQTLESPAQHEAVPSLLR